MAISKVELKNSDGSTQVLVDLTGDTVTAASLEEGKTAHNAKGDTVTGKMINTGKGTYVWKKFKSYPYGIEKESLGEAKPSDCDSKEYSDYEITDDGHFYLTGYYPVYETYHYVTGQDSTNAKTVYYAHRSINSSTKTYDKWTIVEGGPTRGTFLGYVSNGSPYEYPNNGTHTDGYWYVRQYETTSATATAADITKDKIAYVNDGLVIGTHTCSGVTSPKLQSKTVTPSASSQTVKPDSGYDGLSQVTVSGDSDLTASNIKKGVQIFNVTGSYEATSSAPSLQSKTVTPSASSQTVKPDSSYDGLSQVTVNGDADLIASNIKSGVNIFGVTGTYTGSGSGGSSDNNIEAYHITSASTPITFKRTDGTIKVWGYGLGRSTYTSTVYAFNGTGYYSGQSWGTPSHTSCTFTLNSSGVLQGLPSSLTAVDLLVTKGI